MKLWAGWADLAGLIRADCAPDTAIVGGMEKQSSCRQFMLFAPQDNNQILTLLSLTRNPLKLFI